MIDSVGFYIQINDEDYKILINKGIMTQRVDRDNGLVEFEYTNFRVSHSYNYRVQWKVDNKHIVNLPGYDAPQEITGIPYLRFEFSAPKILNGHNLKSVDMFLVIEACAVVKGAFEKMTGVRLCGPGEWYPYRVDVCANFIMNSLDEVKCYIRYLQRLDYPRRLADARRDTGVYFASVHNTFKVYAKGPEFKVHDAERFLNEFDRYGLQNTADKILRIEVELKRRLKYLVEKHEEKWGDRFLKFKGYVDFEDLCYIVNFKEELVRVMNKFLVGKTTRVMRSLEVLNVLSSVMSLRSARMHYAVYMLLVTQGQAEVKRQIPKSVYYRALRVFRENNISIIVSDVEKKEDFKENTEFEYILGLGFPSDFSLDLDESNKYYQLPMAA